MDLVELALVVVFAAVVFVLPQAIGCITYRWAGHKPVAFLIAPVIFFAIAYEYWGYQARAIRAAHHYVCGALGAAATFSTWLGTLFHLVVGAILFTAFIRKGKTSLPA
jgi:hypothetical protein